MTRPRNTGVTRAKLSRNNPQITPSKVPTSYEACVRNAAVYLGVDSGYATFPLPRHASSQDEMVNSQDAADRDVESNVFVSHA